MEIVAHACNIMWPEYWCKEDSHQEIALPPTQMQDRKIKRNIGRRHLYNVQNLAKKTGNTEE